MFVLEELLPIDHVTAINKKIKESFNEEEFFHFTKKEYPRIGDMYATGGILDPNINFIAAHSLTLLEDIVIEKGLRYFNQKYNLNKTSARIETSWLTKSINAEQSKKHNHDKVSLTCVYYYQANPDEGVLRIFNDDSIIDITPVTGKLVIFPGSTDHEVQPNFTSNSRYSLAINLEIL